MPDNIPDEKPPEVVAVGGDLPDAPLGDDVVVGETSYMSGDQVLPPDTDDNKVMHTGLDQSGDASLPEDHPDYEGSFSSIDAAVAHMKNWIRRHIESNATVPTAG